MTRLDIDNFEADCPSIDYDRTPLIYSVLKISCKNWSFPTAFDCPISIFGLAVSHMPPVAPSPSPSAGPSTEPSPLPPRTPTPASNPTSTYDPTASSSPSDKPKKNIKLTVAIAAVATGLIVLIAGTHLSRFFPFLLLLTSKCHTGAVLFAAKRRKAYQVPESQSETHFIPLADRERLH